MQINTIIVQAGGKGTRLEYLTKNKPKALVPVNNLPMLFHLFRKYPDKKFIVIVDYKADVMKKYLAAFAKVEYIVVDGRGKKGTCGGMREAFSLLPERGPFLLIWSDLILPPEFALPAEAGNYVGLSKDFPCRWRYHADRFEEISSDDEGVAGLFVFENKSYLSDVPEEGEFVRWLSEKGYRFRPLPLYKTKEYGLLSEYNKAEQGKTGSRCRPFNQIRVEGDKLIKEGIDEQGKSLAVREKAWYRFVQEKGAGIAAIPKIYSFEPLTMQRIDGRNIFKYELSEDEQKSVLQKLVKALKDLHSLGEAPADYFSINDAYLGKTFARLEKIRDLVPFAHDEYIVINGKPCRNIFFYKDELSKLFSRYRCAKFVFLHGDCTFSNMMLNEDMDPVFIDPRGYFGHTELYGDPNYDWAKLYYSVVGNYDQFNLKRFRLTVKEREVELDIQSNAWEHLEDYFFELIGDVSRDEIKLIHAVIWLSLTTYAWEDYDSICGAFYNGLYYLEDIFSKYLEGTKKFSVPKVNLTFEETLRMLTDSLRSVDESVFNQLLEESVETLRRGNKIIASGLGKNVPICDKFVGSMLSLGLNANFLHTNSAVHGDMGMVKSGDLVIILTKSGSTAESVYLADLLSKREGVNLWLLTFKKHSVLSERLKSLVINLEHEGDMWNIMPNNSTTLNLIVLQALAMNIAKRMGLTLEDFKPNHPGGAIGAQLK